MPRPSTARLGSAKRGPPSIGFSLGSRLPARHGGHGKQDDARPRSPRSRRPSRWRSRTHRPAPRPARRSNRRRGRSDMVGLPRSVSTSAAWTLPTTSSPPISRPKKKSGDEEERDVAGKDGGGGSSPCRGSCRPPSECATRHGRSPSPSSASTAPRRAAITSKAEAEDRRVDAEPLLDQRDMDRPEAGSGAEKEEGDAKRRRGPGRRRASRLAADRSGWASISLPDSALRRWHGAADV